MNSLRFILVILVLTTTGILSASEFSVEKIHRYASYVRATPEVKDYIQGLPPEAINQIVDQLNFGGDGRGKNMFFFSFTCSKISQLRSKGIQFDEDYIFGKLTSFVRSAIANGHVGMGGGAMNSLSKYDHPEVLKLAKELQESNHELTQNNAKLLLKKNEQRENGELRRGKQGQRRTPSSEPSPELNNIKYSSAADQKQKDQEKQKKATWLLVLGIAMLFVIFIFFLRKRVCKR